MVRHHEKIQQRNQIIIIAIIAFSMFLLNYYTPYYADDYNYMYSFATGERILHIKEIFASMETHYETMNGRIVLHFLAQVFLMFPPIVFDVFNTCGFLAIVLLIGFHVYGSWKKISVGMLALTFFLLWSCAPEFGQSFLWTTGASNYLWGILIVLMFLVPYRYAYDREDTERKSSFINRVVKAIFMFLCGIFAGWTNENTGVAMIVMIGIFLVNDWVTIHKTVAWKITGFLGSIIGMLFLLTSPAQQNRLNAVGGVAGIKEILVRAVHISMDIWSYFTLLIMIAVLLYCIGERLNRLFFIYAGGVLISLYSMVAVPVFVGRVWSGPLVLSCILVGMLYYNAERNIVAKNRTVRCLMAAMGLCILFTYGNALVYVRRTYTANVERERIVQVQKAEGKTELTLPIIYGYTKYTCYSDKISDGDLSPFTDYWGNIILARYYGVNKIEMDRGS